MKRAGSVLTSLLAGAVTLASVSCACASTLPLPSDEPAPHVRHHEPGAPENTDCADIGCGGNGGFDAVPPKPITDEAKAAWLENPQDQNLEGADFAPQFPTPRTWLPLLHDPPPPAAYRALRTPVTRFDVLLD